MIPTDGDYYVGFSRGNEPSSWLIGWFGAEYWSHAYTLLPGGVNVVDARADHVGGEPPGVYVRPMSYLDDAERLILRFKADPSRIAVAHAFLLGQEGKPYDKRGILDIATGRLMKPGARDWRDPAAWFCSEFQVWGAETARMIPRTPFEFNRIDPGLACYGWYQAGAIEVARLEAGMRWPGFQGLRAL